LIPLCFSIEVRVWRAWIGWRPSQLLGVQLSGKILGVVGLGRIGSAVARRAASFGMAVHYLSPKPKYVHGFRATWHGREDSFWPVCQFLTLHLPLDPVTRGFLNAARIAQLPPGAILVNSARGELVDDDAVIDALMSGRLAAAGLDVFTGEPDFREEYAKLPQTFILPHLGSATVESRCAMGYRALDNLDAFFSSRQPRDRIA